MCQVTDELLEKTIGEMSGIEFIQLIKAANEGSMEEKLAEDNDKYVYGIAGIAELFHCSLPTANRIKKSGRIKKARDIYKALKAQLRFTDFCVYDISPSYHALSGITVCHTIYIQGCD